MEEYDRFELEELRHKHQLEEIRAKGEQDRLTETLKGEKALELEQAKAENQRSLEVEKGLVSLALGTALGGTSLGLNALANKLQLPILPIKLR